MQCNVMQCNAMQWNGMEWNVFVCVWICVYIHSPTNYMFPFFLRLLPLIADPLQFPVNRYTDQHHPKSSATSQKKSVPMVCLKAWYLGTQDPTVEKIMYGEKIMLP